MFPQPPNVSTGSQNPSKWILHPKVKPCEIAQTLSADSPPGCAQHSCCCCCCCSIFRSLPLPPFEFHTTRLVCVFARGCCCGKKGAICVSYNAFPALDTFHGALGVSYRRDWGSAGVHSPLTACFAALIAALAPCHPAIDGRCREKSATKRALCAFRLWRDQVLCVCVF